MSGELERVLRLAALEPGKLGEQQRQPVLVRPKYGVAAVTYRPAGLVSGGADAFERRRHRGGAAGLGAPIVVDERIDRLPSDLAVLGHPAHRLDKVEGVVEAEDTGGEKRRIPAHAVAADGDDIEIGVIEAEEVECGAREGQAGGVLAAEKLAAERACPVHGANRLVAPGGTQTIGTIDGGVELGKHRCRHRPRQVTELARRVAAATRAQDDDGLAHDPSASTVTAAGLSDRATARCTIPSSLGSTCSHDGPSGMNVSSPQ